MEKYGQIFPAIVRKKDNGRYELIAGHRRKRGCEIAGIETLDCVIRNLTDDEATIIMVDSNFQREKILPSERAFAYKMRLEAMNRQGKRTDLTSVHIEQKLNKTSRELLAEEVGESSSAVQRYIRLTYLIPEILQLVDNHELENVEEGTLKMAMLPAIEISYLTEEEQYNLLDTMSLLEATPSHSQTRIMREESEKGTLTQDKIEEIMEQEKPNQKDQVKFHYDKIKHYFPKKYTIEQMEKVIEQLLKDYQKQWQKKREEYIR